ncbi:RNA polymerase sigma factor [Sutcliffiella horikoshii]|uniref:RNA polymerase sigma factor n=1 Tax=Sutcliffiella horikoshii TaxID=79883 RepID=A0A5D4SMU8_9BACI|nr:RNA polymerase sigma factor [Sutcliffiella horikoshii]TYS63528.1 RNA polymerase sigma factor [Sutcliffiella horikoshii]
MSKPSNEEITKLTNDIYQKLCSMGANPEDAKEIVQESLYRGFLNINGINSKAFKSWLYKVALNQYYDLCRKNNRRSIIEFEDYHLLGSGENQVEDRLIKQETKDEYEQILHKLKPLERDLIKLKYEDEYSYKEISEHLNLKESNVKTYLYRARKKLTMIFRRYNNE